MIDPKAGVASERVPKIFPECVDALIRIEMPDRIGPALRNKISVGRPHLGPEQSVVSPSLRGVNVDIGRHDVEITYQRAWNIQFQKLGSVAFKALEPAKLIVEFRAWRRITVGKIDAPDDDAVDNCFNIPAMRVVRIAGQSTPGF
ncbi:hypothetical protein AJ87_35815 [Rhizobium yanglingense]|nr:hypothetical protein AJ87_35815 [Rhizobium yanglingense]